MFANTISSIASNTIRPPQSASFPSTFEISNEQSRFGTHSLKKNTTDLTTFVTLRRGASNLFAMPGLSSGQGTVEFFYYKTANPSEPTFLFDIQEVTTEICILLDNLGRLTARCRFGATTFTTANVTLANSTWHHIAITMTSNRFLTLWVNGNRIGRVQGTIPKNDSLVTSGGTWWRLGLGSAIAYFNELRVSTIPRYNTNNTTYTVPTSRFVNDQFTYMLYHLEQATGSQLFDDTTIVSGGNLVGTGGTETTQTIDGVNYKFHTFTANGTFTASTAGYCDVLLVGGGGAGGCVEGASVSSGGGGAGGAVLQLYNIYVPAGNHSIVRGAGGTGGIPGTDGGESSAFGYIADGGRRGTSQNFTNSHTFNGPGAGGHGISGSSPQSSQGMGGYYTGGDGVASTSLNQTSGGGGAGAGGNGSNGSGGTGGNGGAGVTSSFTGTSTLYAPGGGGSGYTTAGLSGSGTSTATHGAGRTGEGVGNSNTIHTGGGGGGANDDFGGSGRAGGNGRNGIVVIRYRV